DELADHSFLHCEPVQPKLLGKNQIILWVGLQICPPSFARDGIDLAGSNFQGERVISSESDPERLALIHWHQHTAALSPRRRNGVLVIVNVPQRKTAKASR